jgi:hypothetical protein
MNSENLKLLNWQLCLDRNRLVRAHMGPVRYCTFGGEQKFILSVGSGTRMAFPVLPLAMSWTVRGSNPGCGEIYRTLADRIWG